MCPSSKSGCCKRDFRQERIVLNHGDTETWSKLLHEKLTEQLIGAARDVHRASGLGLLESAYEECLCHELHLRGLGFRRQVPHPVEFKGIHLDCGYRMDALVEDSVMNLNVSSASYQFTKHNCAPISK